ncbi:MAG: hypothetical protein HQL67_08885 [Magnetococcales bacterium]|nr:hypothetical protein [Magnetococcales bacterium]
MSAHFNFKAVRSNVRESPRSNSQYGPVNQIVYFFLEKCRYDQILTLQLLSNTPDWAV